MRLDFPSFKRALDKIPNLSEAVIPYDSPNVLSHSMLYDDALSKLPRELVDNMSIPAYYVFFMHLEQLNHSHEHAEQRLHFRHQAQMYFNERGIDTSEWTRIISKLVRLIHSA